jgi:tetratricopeptide (TPR) repeat protein
VKKSSKPRFRCTNYLDFEESEINACGEFREDTLGYRICDVADEIAYAIFRHSHYYLGLIRLKQGEHEKANLHFKKAIGFNGREDQLGLTFYQCANIINPSWIALASLTRLHTGNLQEAKSLMELAFRTLGNFEVSLDWNFWRDQPEYWQDLKKRGITTEKWHKTQGIILWNTNSIILNARNELEHAINYASGAIRSKDNAVKKGILHESSDHFVLYRNLGVLYSQKGDYKEALVDFDKAIELNPTNAES